MSYVTVGGQTTYTTASCHVCWDLRPPLGVEYPEINNVRPFIKSIFLNTVGCRYCDVLRNAAFHCVNPSRHYSDLKLDWSPYPESKRDPCWDPELAEGVLDIFTLPGQPRFQLPPGPEHNELIWRHHALPIEDFPCGDTGSPKALEQSLRWLDACTKHEKCGPKLSKPLPTRVVDLRDFSWPNRLQLRLYVSVGQPGIWACLSHRWGDIQTVKTLSSNYTSHQANLPWQSLPKTFKEAIIFSSKLNLDFIWIDSLCIIQDSEVDWRTEASKMADIYANAFITLAATKSPNPLGGLFSNVPVPNDYQAHKFSAVDATGSKINVYARKRIPHYPAGSGPHLTHAADFPLLSRAWVWQERLLSPRVLHFTKHELWWECQEKEFCECGFLAAVNELTLGPHVDLNPRSDRVPSPKVKLSDSLDITVQSRANYDNSMRGIDWRTIVQNYSTLSLTYPKDKLTALSGIAKRMSTIRKEKYLAGMWESTMLVDLLWHSYGEQSHRYTDYIAPTWSWASINGSIAFGDIWLRSPVVAYANILQVHAVPEHDETGRCKAGHLIVKAPIVHGTLEYAPYNPEPGSVRYGFRFPDGTCLPMNADYNLREPGRGFVPHGNKIFLLRILARAPRGWGWDTCLVLRRSSSVKGAFKRIGLTQAPEGQTAEKKKKIFSVLIPQFWRSTPAEEIRVIKIV